MSPRLPYWLKLLLAFLAVIIVAAGGAAALASRTALDELAAYLAPDRADAALVGALNRALLVAASLAGGAALVLALFLSRALTAPYRRLAAAAASMAAGKRGLRAQARGGGDEALLARSFNAMAEALEQQEAQRRQLLADIAHELRTPLAVIRGNLEALLDGIYRPTRETIAPIHEEALLLTRLAEELRDLSLAEAGRLPLQLARQNPVELVRGVLSGFQAQASERSVELLLVLPPAELPPVEVDAGRIRQVLANLLSNALRHTPQRGRVRVTLQRVAPRWLEVQVSDSGPGISPEELPHVFSRLYGSERARPHEGGRAGLGLAIARQWIEAHGGSIR
ncbi:MAG: ATP-binding protein, partial [Anaerolineae bacterium]|nr:ATP-binding protein [Anaerolineae bacterium]